MVCFDFHVRSILHALWLHTARAQTAVIPKPFDSNITLSSVAFNAFQFFYYYYFHLVYSKIAFSCFLYFLPSVYPVSLFL